MKQPKQLPKQLNMMHRGSTSSTRCMPHYYRHHNIHKYHKYHNYFYNNNLNLHYYTIHFYNNYYFYNNTFHFFQHLHFCHLHNNQHNS
eukprot:4499427-Amphidinium_carterae.1